MIPFSELMIGSPDTLIQRFGIEGRLAILMANLGFFSAYYWCESLADFLNNKSRINETRNRLHALATFFPYQTATVYISHLTFKEIDADGSVVLEDQTGTLPLRPLDRILFDKDLEKKAINYGQEVTASLIYTPKTDLTRLWSFILPNSKDSLISHTDY